MPNKKSPKRGMVSTKEGTYSKSGRKYGTGHGKKAEFRDFTTGDGDRSMRAGKTKRDLKKANRKASNDGTIQIAKTGFEIGKPRVGTTMIQGKDGGSVIDPEGNTVKNKKVKFGKNKGKTKSVTKFAKENRPSVGGKRRQKNYY